MCVSVFCLLTTGVACLAALKGSVEVKEDVAKPKGFKKLCDVGRNSVH